MNTKRSQCYFLKHNITYVDFRDTHLLGKFIDIHGRIMPRKQTQLSAKYQRKVEQAIKQARIMGLMPFIKR